MPSLTASKNSWLKINSPGERDASCLFVDCTLYSDSWRYWRKQFGKQSERLKFTQEVRPTRLRWDGAGNYRRKQSKAKLRQSTHTHTRRWKARLITNSTSDHLLDLLLLALRVLGVCWNLSQLSWGECRSRSGQVHILHDITEFSTTKTWGFGMTGLFFL